VFRKKIIKKSPLQTFAAKNLGKIRFLNILTQATVHRKNDILNAYGRNKGSFPDIGYFLGLLEQLNSLLSFFNMRKALLWTSLI